jgi:predicted permease
VSNYRRTFPPGGGRKDPDAEIREEIDFYLDLRTEELIERGMTPEQARAEAMARFGDTREIAKQLRRRVVRRQRREGRRKMWGGIWQDLAYAARTMRRNPGFTVVAALTLALALAGNSTLFSVLDAAVLRALPFPDHERLVFVNGYHRPEGGEMAIRNASIPEFRDWRERARTISPMVAVDPNSLALSGDGDAERITAEFVSGGFFELMGGEPVVGRTMGPEELETPDGYPLTVISHGLWQRRFGGDPDVVGRTLHLNERSIAVVGVMDPEFRGISSGVDAWLPLGMLSMVAGTGIQDSRGSRFLVAIGRLGPGVDLDAAQKEMDVIATDLQEQYPAEHEDRFARVQSFRDGYLGSLASLLWVLVGAGGLLLVIAAANVANLLLVRTHARTRELVVRRAMGADGTRVVGQMLVESLVLAAVGGTVGLLLAWWAIQSVIPMIPDGVLPDYVLPALSLRVFIVSLAVVAVAGLAAGMVPAIASARGDLAALIRAGSGTVTGRQTRAQQAFVVTQVGLALLLLVGTGLMVRSVRAQLDVEPGLEMEDLYVFRLDLPRERYADGESLRQFTAELDRRLEAIGAISSVSASNDFPFRGRSAGSYIARSDDPETRIRYHHHSVTPGYFEHLGIQLLRGRALESSDRAGSQRVVVVTQALVDRVFPDDPFGVGRRIWTGNPSNPENLAQDMMEESNSPDVFFTLDQVPVRGLEVSVKAAGGVNALIPQLRAAVTELDSAIPIYAAAALDDLYDAQTATPRFAAFLMGLFSTLALVLACVGIYGVLAFTVGQRAREIAVRRALGARAQDVASSVVFSALRLTLLGLVLGGTGALLVSRSLRSFLFQVEPTDPATFVLVAVTMMLVAAAAAVLPAYRATRGNPVDALTAE